MDWALLARKAAEPITSYPETYSQMNREAREQIAHGIEQLREAYQPGVRDTIGFIKGLGNVGLGTLGYFGSPVSAGLRTIAGKPLEELTGIPKEYTEFGLGLTLGSPLLRLPATGPARSASAFKLPPGVAFDSARALTPLEEIQRMRYNHARETLQELDPRNPQLSALDTSKWFPQSWDVYRLNQEIAGLKDKLSKNPNAFENKIADAISGLDNHHPFPMDFAEHFRALGIEPNDYTMFVDAGPHRMLQTGRNRELWNDQWRKFFDQDDRLDKGKAIEHLNALRKQIYWMR